MHSLFRRKMADEKFFFFFFSYTKNHIYLWGSFSCNVRQGCDGSVLLDHEGSERRAGVSKTLRGFEVIDDIKAEIEKKCPQTVSCADILTAAARDATVLVGGPYWPVSYGRKDGLVSLAKEAESVPMGHEDMTTMIEFFQSKGLNVVDLAILSGEPTIAHIYHF